MLTMQFTVTHTQDEFGADRFFVTDDKGDWIDDPHDTRESALQEARLLAAQTKKLFEVTCQRGTEVYRDAQWVDSQEDIRVVGPGAVLMAAVEVDPAPRRAQAADQPERCCGLAILRPCICRVSFLCPLHGRSCHGSHD